ncbi:hypothetical protein ACU8KH_00993 [Lachancea thermotolerans]
MKKDSKRLEKSLLSDHSVSRTQPSDRFEKSLAKEAETGSHQLIDQQHHSRFQAEPTYDFEPSVA